MIVFIDAVMACCDCVRFCLSEVASSSSCYALSALGASSEATVQETLNALQNEKSLTTLVIGHVFSNIRRVDEIVVVSAGGCIVSKGTHSEVYVCICFRACLIK